MRTANKVSRLSPLTDRYETTNILSAVLRCKPTEGEMGWVVGAWSRTKLALANVHASASCLLTDSTSPICHAVRYSMCYG